MSLIDDVKLAQRRAAEDVVIASLGQNLGADQIKEELINKMADRFCGWPLPKGFGPDCGISFDGRKDDEWNKNKSWPSGTNLLTHAQAKDMIRYMLEGTL